MDGDLQPSAFTHASLMRQCPCDEPRSIEFATGNREDDRFRLVGRGDQFNAVQQKRDLHRGMANSLVPVDKRMVLNQRKAKCGSFGHHTWVEICTTKRLARLSERCLQQADVA